MDDHELELIRRAREDSDAFDLIFRRYKPVALTQMQHVHVRAMAREDWLQEAQIALLRAVRQYQSSGGSQFGSYYKMIRHSHYVSVLRRALAQKRAPENTAASLSSTAEQEELFDRLNRSARNEEERHRALSLDWAAFAERLSPLERRALALCVRGLVPETRQERRALERARAKVRLYVQELQD